MTGVQTCALPILVLTPPPEDWEPAAPVEPTAPAPEPDDETPLLDETWRAPATAAATRIVRHEEPSAEPEAPAKPLNGLTLLGLAIGVTAFVGAVAAFLRGKTTGADEMTVYAWGLAILGIVCVATSVFFLLRRLGGADE